MRLILRHTVALFLSLITLVATGQNTQDSQEKSNDSTDTEKVWKPTFTLGSGVLTYYGDLSKGFRINRPSNSQFAFRIGVEQRVNDYLDAELYFLYGNVAANERSLNFNRNFSSSITAGGAQIKYNFHHLLKENRTAEPYVGVGFQIFEFNAKTDLYDKYGNTYHYWDDGTIRTLPQTPENQNRAIRIQRDYEYETDVRELYSEELGMYDNFSYAIPLSAGMSINLTSRTRFDFGATYHFTFTDKMDGSTPSLWSEPKGDSQNDQFLYVGAGFSFNLNKEKSQRADSKKDPYANNDPFIADVEDDLDQDGIVNLWDQCPNTPIGIPVNEKGCAIDTDGDGVPDYKDEELNTPQNSPVDSLGVALSDEELAEMARQFSDTTGNYSPIDNETYTVDITATRTQRTRNVRDRSYAVKIGEFDESIPDELINEILSLPDVETFDKDGTIIVALGDYNSIAEATAKRGELKQQGIDSEGVISRDKLGNVKDIADAGSATSSGSQSGSGGTSTGRSTGSGSGYEGEITRSLEGKTIDKNKTFYRVQIGAFSQQLNRKTMSDVPNLVSFKGKDGLIRAYAGEFTSYKKAAELKIEMIQKGYDGAYVVALRGGDKISLQEAKALVVKDDSGVPKDRKLTEEEKENNLRFKVQIGAFKKEIPTATLEKYMQLDNLEQKQQQNGVIKYVAGSFKSYEAAKAFKDKLRKQGFDGAFVVGEWKGQIFSAKKAIELSK